MEPQNLSIKLYAAEGAEIPRDDVVRAFHRWIQEQVLDELTIDVADYAHVHEGPGILLVCHEAHYGIDRGEGRLGLLYSRKRGATGTLRERIATAFRKVLTAARRLEEEPSLAGLRFRTDELRFTIEDRLTAPNTAATLAIVRPDLSFVLERLYGAEPTLEHRARPKECFGVDVRAPGAPEVATLLSRA